MTIVHRVLPAVALSLLLVACSSTGSGAEDFDDEKTASTIDALDVGTESTELDDLESAEPATAANELTVSKTKGCRTRTLDTANANVVHVKLENCTGRFERHVLEGELILTFSKNVDGTLHKETKSVDLTIDGRPFSRSASSDIAFNGDQRTVTRHAEHTGTKKNGDSVSRTSDHVVVVDRATRCRTVNGSGHALVAGNRDINTTITDLQMCETDSGDDYCPTGTIEHVNQAKGKTIVTVFDGTPNAAITISKPKGEKTESWTLQCSPKS